MAVDLKALATAVPGLNQQAQQRAQAASNVQLQQQLGAAPRQVPVRAAAQQITAAQSTQMGKVASQIQNRQQQQLSEIGKMGLQQQQQQGQQRLATKEIQQKELMSNEKLAHKEALSEAELGSRKRLTQDSIKSAERLQKIGLDYDERLHLLSTQQAKDLNRIGRDVKQKIFDSRMAFDRDDMGRKFTNSRQMADYTISNAKTEQEARERLQLMQQQSHRKVELLKTIHKRIVTELNRELQKGEAEKDFKQQKYLANLKMGMEKSVAAAEAEAANKRAMIQGASTVLATYGGGYGVAAAVVLNVGASQGWFDNM